MKTEAHSAFKNKCIYMYKERQSMVSDVSRF